MEKSLEDMLHDLQCFRCKSIDLCKMQGNRPGDPWWRIRWMNTAGGEKFGFFQILMGAEGSGIYKDTIEDALEYAKERVINLFALSAKHKYKIFDANDYDWYARGGEDDL